MLVERPVFLHAVMINVNLSLCVGVLGGLAGQHWCFLAVPVDDHWSVHFGSPQATVHGLRSLRSRYVQVFFVFPSFLPLFGIVELIV